MEQLWKLVKEQAERENPEQLLYALADVLEADAETTEHPTVKQLLRGCAKQCRDAGFDYYASLK